METQPVDDINAVLGRFQAWTGARNAAEAKAGVRELSDEEALESGRYKWKGGERRGAAKLETAEVEQESAPTRNCVAKRGTGKKSAAKENATKTVAVTKAGAKPTFRELLVETVRKSEIVAPARQVEVARQAAISVRFAPEDRALIKARAAEAGVSASAYVRQCALEVEQLRAQVQQAIAAIERGGVERVRSPIRVPGFFVRIAKRFFLKSGSTLALRARVLARPTVPPHISSRCGAPTPAQLDCG